MSWTPPGRPSTPMPCLPLPIPGDLVKNGTFRDGLNNWTPSPGPHPLGDNIKSGFYKLRDPKRRGRAGHPGRDHAEDKRGCRRRTIARPEGGYVGLSEQTQGGSVPWRARTLPLRLPSGIETLPARKGEKDMVFWKGFYCLDPEDAAKNPERDRRFPKASGTGISSTSCSSTRNPRPSCSSPSRARDGPAGQGCAREVHLIKSGGKK